MCQENVFIASSNLLLELIGSSNSLPLSLEVLHKWRLTKEISVFMWSVEWRWRPLKIASSEVLHVLKSRPRQWSARAR